MKGVLSIRAIPGLLALSALAALPANADVLHADLSGYNETPSTLSSPATGDFHATVSQDGTEIQYQLTYSGFMTPVLQSHLHLGRPATTGGIMMFLCSNLGNGPAGTQACPSPAGTITGTLTAADVVGPTAQGITPGQFAQVIDAIRSGAAYANIHSQTFPGGEVRGPVRDFRIRLNKDGDRD
jgi:hypothetical protein